MWARRGVPEPLDYERPSKAKILSFTGPVRVIAFGIGGVALGVATCLALWLILGGWGPPLPLFFVGLGLGLGVIVSLAKPAKR
jgi:hypothetical protein